MAACDLRAEAYYLRNRALVWRNLFQQASGFLVGRDEAGTWEAEPGELDPRVWGGSYTETNAWGMAFSAVHDADYLAAVHGGPRGLGECLDRYFAEPEKAAPELSRTYGEVIHEMVEARAIGMGQLGLSNQPAHHVPFMYLFSDRPERTSEVLHECVDRLFDGAAIGQGWPGDEDNGEFSAWWLLVSMGLYPLDVASGFFALTTPQLPAVTWTRPDGTRLSVRTQGEGIYSAAVSVNGQVWTSPLIAASLLHGDCEIVVTLSPEPTGWGRGQAGPGWLEGQGYRHDLTSRGRLLGENDDVARLTDDEGVTPVDLAVGARLELVAEKDEPARVWTLTAAEPGEVEVSVSVRRQGGWSTPVNRRVTVRWPGETRVLELPGTCAWPEGECAWPEAGGAPMGERAWPEPDGAASCPGGVPAEAGGVFTGSGGVPAEFGDLSLAPTVEAVRWTFPSGARLTQLEVL